MSHKHSYAVLTTSFDLEPVLADYLSTYPKGSIGGGEIIFTSEDESDHDEGTKSYIVIFTHKDREEHTPNFTEYLESYCRLHDKWALEIPGGFPSKFSTMHSAGPHNYRVHGRVK